jgi:hypothetical protein
LDGSGVDDLDGPTGQIAMGAGALLRGRRGGFQCTFEANQGEALACGTIGTGSGTELLLAEQTKEGGELKGDTPEGGMGSEDLEDAGPEGAPEGVGTISAVGPLVGLGEELDREESGEEGVELAEGNLAQRVEGTTATAEEGLELGEKGIGGGEVHGRGGIYTAPMDA